MNVKITKPGLSTTVQDLGRPGYYHLGIPISGAMDRYALRVANLLVGNDEGIAGNRGGFFWPGIVVRGPTPRGCDRRGTPSEGRR